MIDPERDRLFAYNGLYLLATRYLASDRSREVYELPQERWLTIALYLMQEEKPRERRMQLVGEAYWALSNLYMTVATPTLANAGKVGGQLSSCFIDTVDDSLQGIYDSNTDIARVSKHGGGVGAYLGYVRSSGAPIRGVANSSGGVVPWIKQLNNTAVSVDQLGQRKGAVAVYLDIWHRDIEAFMDLRLNNGDQRLRAHDVFTSVCVPDLFMEAVERRADWYLFDPHEVKQAKGWYLQDFYDETRGAGSFRDRYAELVADERISRRTVKAIDLFKRIMLSQLETGNPFLFYRDEVNRRNPNKHAGPRLVPAGLLRRDARRGQLPRPLRRTGGRRAHQPPHGEGHRSVQADHAQPAGDRQPVPVLPRRGQPPEPEQARGHDLFQQPVHRDPAEHEPDADDPGDRQR